jgi:hypothetical protein
LKPPFDQKRRSGGGSTALTCFYKQTHKTGFGGSGYIKGSFKKCQRGPARRRSNRLSILAQNGL